jgi:site-specific DNA-methyltransferase (adenine-specific)
VVDISLAPAAVKAATPALVPPYQANHAQRADALDLLRSLTAGCTKIFFFDPQHRENLEHQQYRNEGQLRQRRRCELPQMSADYCDECLREMARVLSPSGYVMRWVNAFQLGSGSHLRVADVLPVVDIIAWDCGLIGQGHRARRRGDYLIARQKPPIVARASWRSKPCIPDRWVERLPNPRSPTLHPHRKPIGLIRALIEATTDVADLVIDPAAGSFVVMRAAHELGREFIGCDLAFGDTLANIK